MAETASKFLLCSVCLTPFAPIRPDHLCCSPGCSARRHQDRRNERARAKRARDSGNLAALRAARRQEECQEAERAAEFARLFLPAETEAPVPAPVSPRALPMYRTCAHFGCEELFRPASESHAYCSHACRMRALNEHGQSARGDGRGPAAARLDVPALRSEMLSRATREALDAWHRETAKLVAYEPDAGVSRLLRQARKRMGTL